MGRQGRELTTNAPLRSIFHILCIRNELGLPPKRMNPPSSRIVGAFLHSGYLAAAEQSRQNSNKLTGSEGRRRRSGWRFSARRSRSSTRAVTRSSSSGTNGRTPAGGYSFCREIIRQMTKFPAAVEIGGEGAAQGSLQSRVYPHRRQMTLQFRSKVGPPQTSHGSSVVGPTIRSGFDPFGAAVIPRGMAISDEKPRGFRSRPKSGEVLEDDHRRVATWCPGDAAAGMRAAPAEVQPPNGRPIAGPSGYRSEGEQLVRGHVSLVDAAPREAPLSFHVER